jgi:hypothetical protein
VDTMQCLVGAVLDSLAGILHILAEAVGRMAARVDEDQNRGETEQNNETFY